MDGPRAVRGRGPVPRFFTYWLGLLNGKFSTVATLLFSDRVVCSMVVLQAADDLLACA